METFGALGDTCRGDGKGGSYVQEGAVRWGAKGTGMLQSDAETETKQLY